MRLFVLYFALVLTVRAEIPVPPFTGYVVDQAGMFTAEEREALSAKLKRFEESGLGQMAVLTVPSLEGEPIERFGMRVAETWKPGSKKKDDGLILIIARDDRALRFEVGYGLEGVINDAKAGDIIRQILVPALREGKPASGIRHAIDTIARLIQPEGKWEADPDTPPLSPDGEETEISSQARIIAFSIFLILFILFSFLSKGRIFFFGGPYRGGGTFRGGFGGGGGGFSGGGGGRFSGGGASGRW